jgi:hypothetical protein
MEVEMEEREEILTRWSVNENLLQWYRSIFIASQSFLLVVGTLFLEKSRLICLVISGISIFIILIIWVPVVRSRHKIVDYYKGALEIDEKSRKQLCTWKEYVECRGKRGEANKIFQIKTNWRKTRWKMDLLMPILFTLIWGLLICYALN